MFRNAISILPRNAGGSLGTEPGELQAACPPQWRLDIRRALPTLRGRFVRWRVIMKSALDGVRVLDFTTTIAGPHCTRLLADLGAEVIKIEPPDGDMMRSRPPQRNGASTSFGQLNAGKKCVVLDLKT